MEADACFSFYHKDDSWEETVEKMRENLRRLGVKVEAELETEIYLSRWLREFKGNAEAAERGARDYIESRRAAGLDHPAYLQLWQHHRLVKQFLPHLSMSKFHQRIVNTLDNSVVVFGRGAGIDYRKLVLCMRSSDIIGTYFAYGEYVMRQVLAQEKESGRPSGAICVFDLSQLAVSEFIGATSSLLAVSRMTINVMQKWYNTEGLRALIFLNPPRILLLSWTFLKMIMNESTRRKIHLLTKPAKQLPSLLSSNAIPEAWGGELRDDSGWCLDSEELCVNLPKPFTPDLYATVGEVWLRFGLPANPPPPFLTGYIPKKGTFALEKKTSSAGGEKLGWMWQVNGEVEFAVTREREGEKELVYPRMTLTTIKLPEEDVIICQPNATYTLTWTNLTSYLFDIRLDYALTLAAPDS